MSFGICYEFGDLSSMMGSLNAQSLPTALKNEVRKYWNAGLNVWDTSPAGVFPGSDPANCPLCHIVTCTYGTLPAFIQLLRDCQAAFVAAGISTEATRYLLALADDLSSGTIGANDSGREPYP